MMTGAALYQAVCRRDTASVRRLLRQGASVSWRDDQGVSPLMMAATVGDEDIFHALVQAGADIFDKAPDGRTLLYFAGRNLSVLHYLLSSGLSPTLTGIDGTGCVHVMAAFGRPEAIALLALYGADVNTAHDNGDGTVTPALHAAARFWDAEAVDALICAGGDPRCDNGRGRTALHAVTQGPHRERNPSDPCARDLRAVIAALTAAGIDIDSQDTQGDTALHAAVTAGSEICASELIAAGASTGVRNLAGLRPYEAGHNRAAIRVGAWHARRALAPAAFAETA